MMNYLKISACLSLLLSFTGFKTYGQENSFKEGRIILQADYSDTTIFNKNSAVQLPKVLILMLKNNQLLVSLNGNGVHSRIFNNLDTRKATSYLQFSDQKFKVNESLDSLEEEAFEKTPYEIIPSTETQTIEGFVCQKATISYLNKLIPDATVYYTTQIPFLPTPLTLALGKLKGFVMDVRQNLQGVPMHLRARKLTAMSVNDSVLSPPDGYKQVSLKQMLVAIASMY